MANNSEIKTKQPPVLFEETQTIIAAIEDICKMPVISYWNAWNGAICQNDVPGMYQLLKKVGELDHAAIVIRSSGGDLESALRLVHLLRRYIKNITVFSMAECASSATIMALGADEIKMGPLAYLTPIDHSLRHDLSPVDEIRNSRVSVSRDELMRIVRLWNEHAKDHHGNPFTDLFNHVHPLVFGAIDRSNSLSAKICDEVLSYHISNEEVRLEIATCLNTGYPSHGYPITKRAAQEIGLKVSDLDPEINDLLLQLDEIYSEMAQNAITDIDESNYHDNQILGISEARDIQIFYKHDKDFNYMKEERRWQTLNDESSWYRVEMINGKKQRSKLHFS